jgi:hypothetical protein
MTNVFFCNRAGSQRGGLKIARKFGHDKGIERPRSWCTKRPSTAARIATMSATGNPKVQAGFGPLVEGLHPRAAERHRGAEEATEGNPNVVAVFFETIQGEGGINPMRVEYLQQVRPVRRARLAADDRRGAVRHGPHRQVVCPPVGRHRARRDAAGQGPGLGRADWRRGGGPQGRQRAAARATTAPPSAATRWPCAPGWKPSASWKKTACWRTPRGGRT